MNALKAKFDNLDIQLQVLTTLELVAKNSNLDIAILHFDNLHGGFDNHVRNELNKKVYSFNYSQDSILTNDCYIVKIHLYRFLSKKNIILVKKNYTIILG